MNAKRLLLCVAVALSTPAWRLERGNAQTPETQPEPAIVVSDRPILSNMRSTTPAMRAAAAARAAAAQAAASAHRTPEKGIPPPAGPRAAPPPGGTPNYFGPEPNWAFSPIIQKFVDSLPGLGAGGANNLGQYIPLAVLDTGSFANSDYCEIAVVEYSQQMHSQLPPTRLRGYVQLETPANAAVSKHISLTYPDGTPILKLNGQPALAVDSPRYLGPLIIAQKDRPVRIKFVNFLPTGAGGDLFIPVDASVMGAGMGPDGLNMYTQNRATLHLHGGVTPWISDGTPHQWTVPAGETTPYPKGVGVQPVPDMWFDSAAGYEVIPGATLTQPSPTATNDPGPGSLTFYYTNQQSARLMFYHDHCYGITRLNVYAGEAAGYLLQDSIETTTLAAVLPASQIPLIIQDKTFVDAGTIDATDPTWNWGTAPPTRNTGDLWFPHVYMPNQNPDDMAGANNFGRWDYGPWFWPPLTPAAGLVHGEIPSPGPGLPATPGTPNPSIVPEAFMDTPVVNGAAYPFVQVQRQAYRLRILNACNDRNLNLQLYYADPLSVLVTSGGSGYTSAPTVTFSGGGAATQGAATATITNTVNSLLLTAGGAGYASAPEVEFHGGGGAGAAATAAITSGVVTGLVLTSGGAGYTSAPTVVFSGGGPTTPATATATITGIVDGITVSNPGAGYTTAPTVTIAGGGGAGATAVASVNTEVRMIPAVSGSNIPPYYPIMDGRAGGVPDPTMSGPKMIQYGTEGGFLASPVVLKNIPIGYDYNRRSITVLNVLEHTLFLGPAERADVIVDFSQIPADVSSVILYNDSPAPVPAFDPRFDYYTGDPDQSVTGDNTGGAPMTLPGYGPNTRTIMRFDVAPGTPAPTGYNLAALQAAWPAAYSAAQPPPVVPEVAYGAASNTYSTIQATDLRFTTGGPQMLAAVIVTNGGSGYSATPTVAFNGGGGTGAAATATVSNGVITNIALTNAGSGYTSPPTVTITDPTGLNATAVASLGMPMLPKAIQELFELNYGRMNATLGVELPFTNFNTQTTIPLGYVDPATEILQDGVPQVWKITHNGVDTHSIHFHLFNVQLVNRVGWDGMIKPPDPNELGWKDTVRMNPLEDVIVALMPLAPTVPFPVPESSRPIDVTMPVNSTIRLVNPVDGNFINVVNALTSFGWEYVWHCHLLGHEENDMMRPIVLNGVAAPQVAPNAPSALTATATAPQQVDLAWTDNSTNETIFQIQRADVVGGVTGAFAPVQSLAANTVAWSDLTVSSASTYAYRVVAFVNALSSAPSNTANVTTPNGPPGAPSALTATAMGPFRIDLAWTLHSTNEAGLRVQRAVGPGIFADLGATLPPGTSSFKDATVLPSTSYSYRVYAFNGLGNSAPSNVVTIITPATQLLAASVTATPGAGHTPLQVLLSANAAGGSGAYTYAWSSNPSVTFSAPTSASTFVTLSAAATYTITLTVSDGQDAVTGVTTITATPPPPPPPAAPTTPPPPSGPTAPSTPPPLCGLGFFESLLMTAPGLLLLCFGRRRRSG